MVSANATRRYSPKDKLEIKLALTFSARENGLSVTGIFQGLEEKNPVVLMAVLEQVFKALDERTV